jgi:hypothetical protein
MELRESMAKHRPLLLLLVCLALAALVWMDNRGALFSGKNASPTSEATTAMHPADQKHSADKKLAAAQSEAGRLLNGNPLASFDKTALQNWVDRPLFAPSRKRPPPQVAGKTAAKPQPPPDYQLLGVVLNRKRTIALLRSKDSGIDVRVQVGDMISGWHVASVDRESVTLKRDDDTSQTVRFAKKDCGSDDANCP